MKKLYIAPATREIKVVMENVLKLSQNPYVEAEEQLTSRADWNGDDWENDQLFDFLD